MVTDGSNPDFPKKYFFPGLLSTETRRHPIGAALPPSRLGLGGGKGLCKGSQALGPWLASPSPPWPQGKPARPQSAPTSWAAASCSTSWEPSWGRVSPGSPQHPHQDGRRQELYHVGDSTAHHPGHRGRGEAKMQCSWAGDGWTAPSVGGPISPRVGCKVKTQSPRPNTGFRKHQPPHPSGHCLAHFAPPPG